MRNFIFSAIGVCCLFTNQSGILIRKEATAVTRGGSEITVFSVGVPHYIDENNPNKILYHRFVLVESHTGNVTMQPVDSSVGMFEKETNQNN